MTNTKGDDDLNCNDSVPGTIQLVDETYQTRLKHANGKNNGIILVPSPSPDPDDPLNWSRKRKLLSVLCMAR